MKLCCCSASETSTLTDAHDVTDTMRTELMYGQYLDLCAAGQVSGDVEAALRTARYTSAPPAAVRGCGRGAERVRPRPGPGLPTT